MGVCCPRVHDESNNLCPVLTTVGSIKQRKEEASEMVGGADWCGSGRNGFGEMAAEIQADERGPSVTFSCFLIMKKKKVTWASNLSCLQREWGRGITHVHGKAGIKNGFKLSLQNKMKDETHWLTHAQEIISGERINKNQNYCIRSCSIRGTTLIILPTWIFQRSFLFPTHPQVQGCVPQWILCFQF